MSPTTEGLVSTCTSHLVRDRGDPDAWRFPTNVCFGGEDLRTLFISVDDPGIIVAVDPGARGRRLPYCPLAVGDHAFASLLCASDTINLWRSPRNVEASRKLRCHARDTSKVRQ